MRGRRVKINEDGDGEVDVNFWAQAAADQANGRRGDEDAGKHNLIVPLLRSFILFCRCRLQHTLQHPVLPR